MTAFVICVGSSLLSKTVDVTYIYIYNLKKKTPTYLNHAQRKKN